MKLSRYTRNWPVDLFDAVGGFDPITIPGLEGWFDADDSGTITIDTGKVSQWDDKSGEGNDATQITPGNRPVVTAGALNGKAVLTFAVDDFMASVLGITQPATVFVVFKTTAATIYSPLLSSADAGARAETLLTDADKVAGFAGTTVSGGSISAGTYYQMANIFNGASSKVFQDGDEKAAGDMGAQNSVVTRIASSPDTPA